MAGANHKGMLSQAVKAVLWSFFGVRKRQDLDADATQLKPLYLIATALIAVALLIATLLLIVRAVVG